MNELRNETINKIIDVINSQAKGVKDFEDLEWFKWLEYSVLDYDANYEDQ